MLKSQINWLKEHVNKTMHPPAMTACVVNGKNKYTVKSNKSRQTDTGRHPMEGPNS